MPAAISSAGPAAPAGAEPHRRVLPTRRQLVIVVAVALVMSGLLRPMVRNPFIEIAGELLFVAMMVLFAYSAAGAWRVPLLPRWLVQVVAVAAAAMLSPFIVQMLTFGGDLSAFLGSRGHVRGYILVATVAVIVGTLF